MIKFSKKLFIAFSIGMIAGLFAINGVVLADNGPHGDLFSNATTCSICHRQVSLQTDQNFGSSPDPDDLCLACHNGTGAGTNVVDGLYLGVGSAPAMEGDSFGSLLAGGFTNALMATSWTDKAAFDPAYNAVSNPVTSSHSLGTAEIVWGADDLGTHAPGMTLQCISCHNPHGDAGWDLSSQPGFAILKPTYRLLRWQPIGSNGFSPPSMNVNWSGGAFPSNTQVNSLTGWLIPDNYLSNEWYTIGTMGRQALGDYSTYNPDSIYLSNDFNYTPAAANIAYFCAQCHDSYFNNGNLSRHNTGDVLRDSIDGTFNGQDASELGRSCLACHVAHGSSAAVSAAGDTSCLEAVGRSLSGTSALLRMDGREICLSCHLGDVGWTVGPDAESSHNQFSPLEGVQCARCHSIHSPRQ